MKTTKKLFLVFVSTFISISSIAQSGNVKLRGTRLTYPIFRKWIAEFNKSYPDIKVEITPKAPADSIDLSIAAYKLGEDDYKNDRDGITVTRYAQLSVANSNRPGLSEIQLKGFSKKDFKQVYFKADQQATASIGKSPITIYRRETATCASKTFAKHYGNEFKDLNGTGVNGDDQDLLTAVKRDINGLTYNNLGFIYNIKTRKVADSIAVVPLDLNENGKVDADEKIYNTLDEVINFIEKTENPNIPVEGVNVIFSKNSKNKAAAIFLNWVLLEGQKFNHEYGFINQTKSQLTKQNELLSANFK